MIIIGWGWELLESDQRAYSSIKDTKLKDNIWGFMKHHCYSRGFGLSIEPDEVNLKVVKISKQLKTINKPVFLDTIFELKYKWVLLMELFEKNNMSRSGFDSLLP